MQHVSVPIILVVVGALVVLLAVLYTARQFVVARRLGGFECSLWRRALIGRDAWQLGLMRYGLDSLRWYRAFSLRIRPEVTVRRRDIVDLDRREVPATVEGLEDYELIDVRTADGTRTRLLVGRSSAAGLLAWLEAAPAGSVVRGID